MPAPGWSAHALRTHPQVVGAIHTAYAQAGATVHTANTFRTARRALPTTWRHLAARAIALARDAVPAHHRVAGSMAPLEDCYRPDLSPPTPGREHRNLAEVLAEAGSDLLLCETFPHVEEGLAALQAAMGTGLPCWLALTGGPGGDLLTPKEVGDAGRQAAEMGAAAVLINCTRAVATLPYVEALVAAMGDRSCEVGAYANAGKPSDGIGWNGDPDRGVRRYAALADRWAAAGATILGSCCGTGVTQIAALAERYRSAAASR